MNQRNLDIEKDLRAIVGERVTTSGFERWHYQTDIMHIPRAVKSFFKTMPDAVVKPNTVEQVAEVVNYCNRHGIPLVPRGGGSSGLFGAVPKQGGVLLDLMDLDRVLGLDREQGTVTAEAGLTWWELEKQLDKQGFTLRSYPSSARSATLGGWVMTSGLGIGSLKYGSVFDQLNSIQIIHADGSVKDYEIGFGVQRFFETEGMLGVLTKLTLKVRHKPEKVTHHLINFDDIRDLFNATTLLARREPVPYSLEFFDAKYLSLLRESGYPTPDFKKNGGILLVTLDGTTSDVLESEKYLAAVIRDCQGVETDGGLEHWQARFKMLRVRRAVPSLLPTSIYIPIEQLSHIYRRLSHLKKRPLALLGYITSATQCNLMPLIVTDDKRPLEYMFSLHTPREIINLALSVGGKPGGGVGIWNAPYRNAVQSKRRVVRMRLLKRAHDPFKILNPGMWLDPPLIFTPVVYQSAMAAMSVFDPILPKPKSKKLTGFEKELDACVQCGYCMNYCPTRLGWISTTPRGRVLSTRELFLTKVKKKDYAPEYLNRLYQCTMCGRCGVDCSVDIKSRPMWLGTRKHLGTFSLSPDNLKELSRLVGAQHNIAGRPNDQRAAWTSRVSLPYDLKSKKTAPVVYFVGCVASFFPMVQPSARAFAGLLNAAGVDFTIVGGDEWCCGFPLLAAGDAEGTRVTFNHNLERMKDIGAQTIVMTCPGCYKTWKEEYTEVIEERHPYTVLHSTEFLAQLVEQKKLSFKPLETVVTYHDPCDLGRNAGLYDEPRRLITSVPGLTLAEMGYNREYCTCCGSGGDLLASNQELSLAIASRKLKEIKETGAPTAVTACPSCVRAISMAKTAEKTRLDVVDITELLWKATSH